MLRRNAAMIVVGSSPNAQPGTTAIGRRTQQLLERATCALAVAPRGWHERGEPKLTMIGIGYDGEPEASAALQLAATLARAAGVRLHVRAVVHERLWAGFGYPAAVGYPAPLNYPAPMDWKAVIEEAKARLRNQLATAVWDLDGDVETDVTVGSASAEFEDLSRSVDLLVIGSRRWGAIARVVNGSVETA